MVRGRLGICSAGGGNFGSRSCRGLGPCPFRSLRPGLVVGALGPLQPGGSKALNSVLRPCEGTSCHHTALPGVSACKSLARTEVAGDSHEFLWSLCRDRALLCRVPITPYWDLASPCVLQVQGQHGLNSAVSPHPVLLSTATSP
jgi:hypothetical protein